MRDQFVRTTTALLDEHDDMVVVLAEISAALFRESGALAAHPDRVINVGIREQLMVGVAAGMALEGFRPVVHTYAPFLTERAFEQVKLDFTHQGTSGILVSVGASRDAAGAGRTHQAPEDVALMATLPDWTIVVPGHGDEAEEWLRRAVAMESPVYLRLTDGSNDVPVPQTQSGWSLLQEGKRDGPTVVAVGPMLDPVVGALERLDGGESVRLIYTTRPKPVDAQLLRTTVTSEVVLVAPYLEGTGIAEMAAVLSDRPTRFLSIGYPCVEERRYGTSRQHATAAGLDAAGIARALGEFFR